MRLFLIVVAMAGLFAPAVAVRSETVFDKTGTVAVDVRTTITNAENGQATAQYNLGVMSEKGNGVKQDYAEAVKWYRKAALQGDAEAQSNLGTLYSKGLGVEQSDLEAINLFRSASAKGDAGAQYNLGWMYSKGQGVQRDDVEAAQWLRKSSNQGFAKAQSLLGWMYSTGTGVQKDKVRTYLWLHLASMNGNEMALRNLATLEKQISADDLAKAKAIENSCQKRRYLDCDD